MLLGFLDDIELFLMSDSFLNRVTVHFKEFLDFLIRSNTCLENLEFDLFGRFSQNKIGHIFWKNFS